MRSHVRPFDAVRVWCLQCEFWDQEEVVMFLHMVFIELGSPLLQKVMGEVNFTGTCGNTGQTFV